MSAGEVVPPIPPSSDNASAPLDLPAIRERHAAMEADGKFYKWQAHVDRGWLLDAIERLKYEIVEATLQQLDAIYPVSTSEAPTFHECCGNYADSPHWPTCHRAERSQ